MTMSTYETRLRAELRRHGFLWFPLSAFAVAELRRREVPIGTAYKVACDIANGSPFAESLAANLLDD